MKVNQDTQFTTDTIVGSGGILYALANKTTITDDEGRISYEAELIEIKNESEASKAILDFSINSLTVTTKSGNTFDATLTARQNMADGILASETLAIAQTTWRLADNTEVLIDITELREAHALALIAYATAKSIGV